MRRAQPRRHADQGRRGHALRSRALLAAPAPRPHPIGEVRGAEALDLLKAWGTGHPGGIGTIHAGTGIGALRRLEQLIQEAVVTVPRALIAETIDLVAVLSGRGSARRLAELARVEGLGPDGDYRITPATLEPHRRPVMIRTRCASAAMPRPPPPSPTSASSSPRRPCLRLVHAVGSAAAKILESIEGPVAKIVAVIIIIATGLTLAFGDTSGGFRKLIQIVFGLSIAFAASSFFLSFFSFGGGALV
jgi:type IV secretory pathway VirB2 component (pilin)